MVMSDIKLAEPRVQTVKRVIEYEIHSHAEVEGFDKAIGLRIESNYGGGIRLYLDNFKQSKQIWKYLDNLFAEYTKNKESLHLVTTTDLLPNKEFLAEWQFDKNDLQKILNKIESKLDADWKNAFLKIWSVYYGNLG